jgi:glycosyltransferase involved in cell wall biosynthesis
MQSVSSTYELTKRIRDIASSRVEDNNFKRDFEERARAIKLVVMIPAFNEEESIASVIKEIPRDCCGVVEVLVIDDGSTDNTFKEATGAGADNVIRFKENRGLAPAFRAGLEAAIAMGADIIVNTDADGQYDGNEIPRLIKPILENKADVVLGSRTKGTIEDMPVEKRIGNRIATFVTSLLCGRHISDAQTGFRAFARDAAMRLNVMANYTYVQETLIQLSHEKITMVEVPITFRKRKGKSRLISGVFNYAKRAGLTIMRTYRDYHPLLTFLYIGSIIIIAAVAAGAIVLYHYFTTGVVTGKLPMALLSVLLFIIASQVLVVGLLADMLKSHKQVQDEILYRLKKVEYAKKML